MRRLIMKKTDISANPKKQRQPIKGDGANEVTKKYHQPIKGDGANEVTFGYYVFVPQ